MTDIHSCSYFCERPECVLMQRNFLRDRLTVGVSAERTLSLLGYTNNGGEYWKPPLGKCGEGESDE